MALALSAHLAFFRRGEARFVHHELTGGVMEMSPGVLRLLLSFERPRVPAADERSFCDAFAHARFLVPAGEEGAGEAGALDGWRVVRFRWAVWEETPQAATIWTAGGRAVALDETARAVWARAAEEPALGALAAALGPAARDAVFALARAEVGALKLAPSLAPRPPGLHSTVPFERFDPRAPGAPAGPHAPDPADLHAYHRVHLGGDAGAATHQFEDVETTLSHLFRDPHPALEGRTYGEALADALLAHGLRAPRVIVEIGGGTGLVAARLLAALAARGALPAGARWFGVDLAPALLRAQRATLAAAAAPAARAHLHADALRLPWRDGTADLVVANEMAGDLPPDDGPRALVREAARLLRPGGLLFVSEFGDPERAPVASSHLDHDEHSVRFADLEEEARSAGLDASLVCIPDLLDLRDAGPALWTTRGSFAALRALAAAHGLALDKRAWTRAALEAAFASAGLDPGRVRGLRWGPGSERVMGLRPREFWSLLARRPRAG